MRLVYALDFPSQIDNAPAWASEDRYQVEINSATPIAPKLMEQVVLARVLTECFSLSATVTQRTVPGYALVVAPTGRKFAEVEKPPPFRMFEGVEHLSTLDQLATVLTQYYYYGKLFGVNRPVHNATGLKGFYDIPFPAAPEPETNLLAATKRLGLDVFSAPGMDSMVQLKQLKHLRGRCNLGSIDIQSAH